MLEYFQDEIFKCIPEKYHLPFLKLSFVDEIHANLAKRITGITEIDTILRDLTRENLFIYNLDPNYTLFRFHHFFQEFLQARAAKKLDPEAIRQIYSESAGYYLENNLIDKALSCYLQGGEYEKMDHLLHRYGVDIIAQNRTFTILTLLHSIPEKTLLRYSWLTLFSGILESDYQPQKTLPHLEAARKLFVASGEETGELLAIATILYYHFVVSGRYHTGASLLPRTVELLENNFDTLSRHIIVLVTRNLAAGYCFFCADMEKARHYIKTARSIAIENDIRNFMASTIFIKAYIELFSGSRQDFTREVQISHSLLNDPLVGMSNKLTLRILHICSLSMYGDITNFFHQQQLIQNSIDEKVVKQTVAAPYFFIWGCSCLISLGESAKALELINRGVTVSETARSEHMLSQLLQWQAYIHALHGNHKSAAVKIKESSQLREIAGGPFYSSFHAIMAGTVHARLKNKKLAKDAFSKGLKIAESIPSPYLAACCLMQRSVFKMNTYGEEAALDDLSEALNLMARYNYDHFWSWEPSAMLEILVLAVKHDLQRTFCRKLARKRLQITIHTDGTFIPLLHFTVLDSFSIGLPKGPLMTVDQFTPMQREILSLILFSKNKKISQDKAQLILWPESSPHKSRRKLDTLLGRLRSAIADALGIDTKEYISLTKGILCLENTTADVEQFQECCTAGFKYANNGELWEAGTLFHKALTLWKGHLPTDTFRNDLVYDFEDSLLAMFEKMSIAWAGVLADAERHNEAIPILSKLLRSNAHSEEAVLMLCRLYTATQQPLKVRASLDKYKKSLQKLDYDNDEIDAIIEEVSNALQTN
jgi:ATP/maltotriose-dependent transcriptional regulator MalT/DNA-binding SARP family transcriptional activator